MDYFSYKPERILWVYGPKSTGKTTLIEYIVENHLLKDENYNVKYINFRRKMISNYENFFISNRKRVYLVSPLLDFLFIILYHFKKGCL